MLTRDERKNETLEEKISALLEAGFKICNKGRVTRSPAALDVFDPTKPDVVMVAKGDVAALGQMKAPNLSHCIVSLHDDDPQLSTITFALPQSTPVEKVEAIYNTFGKNSFIPYDGQFHYIISMSLSSGDRTVSETLQTLENIGAKTTPFPFDSVSLSMLPQFCSGKLPKERGVEECLKIIVDAFGDQYKGLFGLTRRVEEKAEQMFSATYVKPETSTARLSR